ncbi:hypothetical protein EV360DRAFT_88396, partial [Lentinula raphanica]
MSRRRSDGRPRRCVTIVDTNNDAAAHDIFPLLHSQFPFPSPICQHPYYFSAQRCSDLPSPKRNPTPKICWSNLKNPPASPMHLCRIFTWHLFVANILILSMISAAPIASPPTSQLPSQSKKRPFSKSSVVMPGRPSKKQRASDLHTPKNYYIIVYPHRQRRKTPTAGDPIEVIWIAGLVPVENESDLGSKKFYGYQTQWQSPAQWTIARTEKQRRLNGASVHISKKEYPCIIIGTATTTPNALRKEITPEVHEAVIKHHSDKLPNLVSIYQYLIHLEEVLKKFSTNDIDTHAVGTDNNKQSSVTDIDKRPLVTNLVFDISDSSKFMKAFKEMIEKKSSAAGFQLNPSYPWEMDLYDRIGTGKLTVPEMVKEENKKEMEIRRKYLSPLDPENQDAEDWIRNDLYVICQLIADNKPLTIPFRTSFKAFKNAYIWNEWITFPIRYCDLPLSAQITFTIWDIAGPRSAAPVGGTTFRLFGKKWTLRRGKHRLLLWPGIEADGSVDSATPSKIPGTTDEMGRLEKLVKKYERGDLPKSEWLDKMTFRKMEEIHSVRTPPRRLSVYLNVCHPQAETQKSENLFLYIDLPRFDFPVIFNEPESLGNPASTSTLPPPSLPPPPQTPTQPVTSSFASDNTHLWTIVDPEITRENPVEDKHRRLVRSHRSGPYDRELKPNSKDRDNIGEILNYAPSQPLSPEEKDLIWKFRFHLARDKRGLTKFLKAVTWRDPSEVKQAVEELLPQWTEIDMDDALELLGPGTVDSRVRAFAVRQLARADDEELFLYLLQLVQALKFESAATDQ